MRRCRSIVSNVHCPVLPRMPSLRVILDRFDNDKVIFLTQEGQQLVWHRDDLPETIKEGGTYYMHFGEQDEKPAKPKETPTPKRIKKQIAKPATSDKPAKAQKKLSPEDIERHQLARTMLEEILNGKEPVR